MARKKFSLSLRAKIFIIGTAAFLVFMACSWVVIGRQIYHINIKYANALIAQHVQGREMVSPACLSGTG